MTGRIDVHHHILPTDYMRWLHEQGITDAGGWQLPEWTATKAVEAMDRHGIATGMLSLSAPGTHLGGVLPARHDPRGVQPGA